MSWTVLAGCLIWSWPCTLYVIINNVDFHYACTTDPSHFWQGGFGLLSNFFFLTTCVQFMYTLLECALSLQSFLDTNTDIVTSKARRLFYKQVSLTEAWINLKLRLILVSPCNLHWLIWWRSFFQFLWAADRCLIFCFVICLLGKILIQKGGYQEK